MTTTAIEILGTLQPNGTLVLDEKPALPPGRVRVTIRTKVESAVDQFHQLLCSIRDAQRARGQISRSVEEIDSARRALRVEMDREIEEAGRLQEESRWLRQKALTEQGKSS
jgi:hypothetical protein